MLSKISSYTPNYIQTKHYNIENTKPTTKQHSAQQNRRRHQTNFNKTTQF